MIISYIDLDKIFLTQLKVFKAVLVYKDHFLPTSLSRLRKRNVYLNENKNPPVQ